MIRRREFICNSLVGAGCLLFNRAVPFAATDPVGDDSRIEVLLGAPLGTTKLTPSLV